jgi:hypothetical protein
MEDIGALFAESNMDQIFAINEIIVLFLGEIHCVIG